jgi:hypothetical protein
MAILVLPLVACQTDGIGFPTSGGKTSISNATMCTSVDLETGEPIEPTDTFATTTPLIFCSVKVSKATPDTMISAEWLYLREGDNDETGLLIADWNTTTEGTHYIPLSITRPENGWPQGDYKLVFYLEDEKALSTSFKVQ